MPTFWTKRRVIILAIVAGAGFIAARLLIRAALNLLLGGTLFGGNWL